MSKSKLLLIIVIIGFLIVLLYVFISKNNSLFGNKLGSSVSNIAEKITQKQTDGGGLITSDNPYSIPYLRKQDYPGSEIVTEQTLSPGSNYDKYITSYRSEGLKIYALMTIPTGEKPKGGWPVIIFNHGYIPPAQYRTAERYEEYVDAFARNGYIVFKSDYRGNGNSEGTPTGHFGPGYTIDVLNALSSIKKYKDANPQKIGMWGHSLGGAVTLNSMVLSKDIKAGSIWAGTVGPIDQEFRNWGGNLSSQRSTPSGTNSQGVNHQNPIQQFGSPEQNPQVWASMDPLNYLQAINVPVEIQQGLADEEVNPKVSQNLYDKLKALGKTVDYYTYPGDNHNISIHFNTAIQRSVDFFNKYLKGGE